MLDTYQRSIIERIEKTPRNLNELATMLKVIDERPGLAVYNYCDLTDLHQTTFYRNMKILRQLGLVHPTRFKVTPAPKLKESPVVEETEFDKWVKRIPVTTIAHRHAVAVAKNPTKEKTDEVTKLLKDTMTVDEIQKFLDLLALFQIANGTYHNYADKETEGFVDYETLQNNLRDLLS